MITQEQFNEIIDLLGDLAIARVSLDALKMFRCKHSDVEKHSFQAAVDDALTQYNQAVATLYQGKELPKVYSSAYYPGHDSSAAKFSENYSESQAIHSIDISPVIKQLNQDFVLCDNTDEEFYTPFLYTGRYRELLSKVVYDIRRPLLLTAHSLVTHL